MKVMKSIITLSVVVAAGLISFNANAEETNNNNCGSVSENTDAIAARVAANGSVDDPTKADGFKLIKLNSE